ncbi:MAG: TdeIII family type II restriction endonuclease [Syntrophorhabdaceae bacterium]|nr:TdeIII family type II restriction endonuclease [Syntrophorhabdales bacterium]MBP9561548.1 TdeIII family type II restriction endonuclease [Syntrophorhabdaceae bacterium]
MILSKEQIEKIEHTIKDSLRSKFRSYKPETKNMPFHYRLLGRDRVTGLF